MTTPPPLEPKTFDLHAGLFKRGPYRITVPGLYRLKEDVEFASNPNKDYFPTAKQRRKHQHLMGAVTITSPIVSSGPVADTCLSTEVSRRDASSDSSCRASPTEIRKRPSEVSLLTQSFVLLKSV